MMACGDAEFTLPKEQSILMAMLTNLPMEAKKWCIAKFTLGSTVSLLQIALFELLQKDTLQLKDVQKVQTYTWFTRTIEATSTAWSLINEADSFSI